MSPPALLLIPAWNEAQRLPGLLAAVERCARAHDLALEVVVVDDGSSDATARVAAQAGARVLRHPFNLGYGAALQTGYLHAHRRAAPWLVQMDGDGQHDPEDIPRLLAPLRSGEADLVLGSRFLESGAYRFGFLRRAGRGLFTTLAAAFGLRLTDPTSGFQAMSAGVVRLYTESFFPSDYPDVDVLLTAHRHGIRIRECQVSMKPSPRRSTLHGGLRPVYYLYKMLLSVWARS